MNIYCTAEFKTEFDKLMRKNSYKNLEKSLIDFFFAPNSKIDAFKTGVNLLKNNERPYIKKRINGSGGYRCYYYLLIKDNNLYLNYIHPKTGVLGSNNTTTEKRKQLLNDLIVDIQNNTLITVINKNNKLVFI